jgi:hypothetical protein
MTVTINAYCDKGRIDGTWGDVTTPNDECNIVFNYYGDQACKFYDVDISRYFQGLTKFMGAISIGLGLVLTFYGSKFILIVFGLLCFLITQMLMWLVLYNTQIFKPEEIESKVGIILAIAAVIFLVGAVASYYMAKFADNFAVPMISTWCGGIIAFMLISATKVPPYGKFAIIIFVAGTAGYYSYKVQRFVKSAGTALIGSFILFNGIGKYAGGYPNLMDMTPADGSDGAQSAAMEKLKEEMGAMAMFYIGGTIFVAILGTWVQLTYVSKAKEDEDDFMNSKDA